MTTEPLHSLGGDDFWWGVASAGHQVEGGNDNADIWFLEQQQPSVFREPSGAAIDSWNRWPDDVALTAGLGCNAFRFSVEWARIEPTPGEFSSAALDHYDQMVDACLAAGLTPIVTYNHFAAPHWFASRGGFLTDDAGDRFARYATEVTRRLGDRLGAAITFNEPNLHRMLAWAGLPEFVRDLERATLEAAARSADVERYRVSNVMLPEEFDAYEAGFTHAHTLAKAAIKAERGDLPIGLSVAMTDDCVVAGAPTELRDRKRADAYDHWLRLAADDDFIGVQNYERRWYDAEGEVVPDPDAPKNGMGSAVDPGSLEGAVRYAHQVADVPVLVTEHGMSTPDDTLRAGFLRPALEGLAAAVDDSVPVLGYLHWTLADNFEWIFGFEGQLGLHVVDRSTFDRSPKPSAEVYRQLIAASRG